MRSPTAFVAHAFAFNPYRAASDGNFNRATVAAMFRRQVHSSNGRFSAKTTSPRSFRRVIATTADVRRASGNFRPTVYPIGGARRVKVNMRFPGVERSRAGTPLEKPHRPRHGGTG